MRLLYILLALLAIGCSKGGGDRSSVEVLLRKNPSMLLHIHQKDQFVSQAINHDFWKEYFRYYPNGNVQNLLRSLPVDKDIWLGYTHEGVYLSCRLPEKDTLSSWKSLTSEQLDSLTIENKKWYYRYHERNLLVGSLKDLPQWERETEEEHPYEDFYKLNKTTSEDVVANLFLSPKKNQEFVHIATQQFIKDGKTDAEIKAIFEEVIPQILEEQTKGTTARSLYGAPTHWAHSFTVKEQYEKEHPKENDDPKLMIMDSALFITSLFALVSALTTFFAADQAFGYGLVTLLLVGLVGGFAFYLMYYFVYQYYGPDMDRSQRPPFWKSVLVILASMFLWLLVFFATSFLPASLNPVLAPLPLAIIGAALLALRFYLKKRLNIRSASAGPTRY